MRQATQAIHGINTDSIQAYLQQACLHYEKSAPAVSNYLDDLYIRVSENTLQVTLFELLRSQQLQDSDSHEWMHPNYAQNTVYKTLDMLGRDTAGMIDF